MHSKQQTIAQSMPVTVEFSEISYNSAVKIGFN